MYKPRDLPRQPTEAEYAAVKDVYEKTGVLTIKDKKTAAWVKPQERCGGVKWETPFQNCLEYGETKPEVTPMPGVLLQTETYMVRATYVLFVGTKKYEKGLACGGYEVWRQDNFFEDTEKFSCTGFRFDISPEEIDRLMAWCNERVYVTDEMWKAAEDENRLRRQHQSKAQIDPVGVVAEALAAFASKKTAEGAPAELLAEVARLKEENAKLLAGAKK